MNQDTVALLYMLQQLLSNADVPALTLEDLAVFSISDEDNLFGRLVALRMKGLATEQKSLVSFSQFRLNL